MVKNYLDEQTNKKAKPIFFLSLLNSGGQNLLIFKFTLFATLNEDIVALLVILVCFSKLGYLIYNVTLVGLYNSLESYNNY
jgi:hypothetical protein